MTDLIKNLPMPDEMSVNEIRELLLREEYGFLPSEPERVWAETESCDEGFCAGKAELIKLKLICETEYGRFSFPVYYTRPVKIKHPMPCFIHINFRDLVPDKCQPSEELADNGFAVFSFCYQDVSSDDGDFTNGLAGLIYPEGKRNQDQCGKIGLWAWAAMRVMDYALTLEEIDPNHISVAGHSRLGKTALLTGALDERFFCAFSNDSGCSGAAISRGKRGESIRNIMELFPYWFCENYQKYVNKEEEMPFDQHFLLAANAKHKVYVASAEEDIWADPEKEFLSCVAASSYYEKMGKKGIICPEQMPRTGDAFHRGDIGYHLREGKHYFSREDWNYYIKYLKLHMQ